MGDLHLSEPMQRYFLDLFSCCDDKKAGKIHITRLIDVLKTGGATDETILHITSICSLDSTVTYLNRKQFCSALKLLAAHQANLQLSADILPSNQLEIPLPRLKWPQVNNCGPHTMANRRDADDVSSDLIELRDGDDYRDVASSTDSEVDSETLSIGRNGSPGASSAASDSPTPTNSVQDRSWAVNSHWHGLVSEEQRQLLGTEEESSDRHSSDEDTEATSEVWTITAEQRDYYTAQFRNLQPDLNALLPGSIARKFFEMSRLHVQELRKIWTLADTTKDGALSLAEFNVAMHLVVLRRNRIELPDTLPAQLQPVTPPETESILRENAREWTKFAESPTSVSSPGPKPVNFDFQKGAVEKDPKILHPVALRLTPEVQCGVGDEGEGEERVIGGEGVETLVNVEATVMIQRPQPKKLVQYHMGMVPGALPPPPNSTATNNNNNNNTSSASCVDGPVSLPVFPPATKGTNKDKQQQQAPPPPPPPRPFKTHGRSSSLDLNRLNKSNGQCDGYQLPPPMVPPRVSPSSGDSHAVGNGRRQQVISQRSEGSNGGGEVKGVVQRGLVKEQISTEFANFDAFEQYENVQEDEGIFPGDKYEADRRKLFAQFTTVQHQCCTAEEDTTAAETEVGAPRRHGAFEVYRKPTPRGGESPAAVTSSSVAAVSDDLTQYEQFVRLQEQNTVLLRLCQELSQELADVREQKMTMKVRLERQQQQPKDGAGKLVGTTGSSRSASDGGAG